MSGLSVADLVLPKISFSVCHSVTTVISNYILSNIVEMSQDIAFNLNFNIFLKLSDCAAMLWSGS